MSVPALKHFGHGELAGPASLYYLNRHRRTVSLAFQSAGGEVRLPSANRMPGEGPDIFRVFNVGGDPFDLADHTGGLVGVIPAGQMGVVDLCDMSSEAGGWCFQTSGVAGPSSSISSTSSTPPASSPSIPTDPTEGSEQFGTVITFAGTQPAGLTGHDTV